MGRITLGLGLTAVATGCLGPLGLEAVSQDGAPDLALTVHESGSREWFMLENRSGGAVRLECKTRLCGERSVALGRVDALQESGEWIDRGDRAFLSEQPDAWIAPDSSDVLDSFDVAYSPGTYRMVVRVVDEHGETWEVSHELAVLGWSEETLQASRDLLERASAECTDVRDAALDSLRRRLEPDALLDVEAEAENEIDQFEFLLEMARRGTFVDELALRVAVASMDDVRLLQEAIPTGQTPVRRVVAARFFDVVADHETPLENSDPEALEGLDDVWPDDGPALLVERLAHGRDEGPELEWIVEALFRADVARFEPHRETILAALHDRCAGSTDELREACDLAIDHFVSGEEVMRRPAPHVQSFRCTLDDLRFVRPAACSGLETEWAAIEARAGDLRIVHLGDRVVRAAN